MRAKIKVLIAIGLAAVMILMFAGKSFAEPPDIQNHWAEKQISDWVERGYISGYPDGSFRPENSITRAEFITMVNSSFGKNATSQVSFPDVSGGDWFAAEVAKALAAGYISGYDDGAFRPNESIKRMEAAVIITKLLNLDISADTGVLNQFADYADFPQWSKDYIGAVVSSGYMSGYPDQTYQPEGYITRAEAVSTLDRALTASVTTVTYDKMGTYGPANGIKTIDGSVNISAAGVTLQNTVITGNLFLADSIGDGDVTLKNVIVQGNTVIKGGGSQSVVLENCSLPNITVGKEGVRIAASGNTSVSIVRLETGATLLELSLSGPGFETVTVAELVPAGAEITLDGNFDNVNVAADAVSIDITGGTVTNLDIAEGAAGAVINIAAGAKVSILTLNAVVSVTGEGTVETAILNVSGSTFEREPNNIKMGDDITVTTGAGGGGTLSATITISNIEATNTLGKFKFDTDTVTTIAELEGNIMADGVNAIDIAKRNSGENGKVWNAFVAATPYEYNQEYEITCKAPFKISGNNTVIWSDTAAAPAAINVTAKDIDNNGNGSDLEVSFDSQKGQNTRIESYRVMVVKSGDASSFKLSDANGATDYTTVDKVEDAPSYTVVLDSDANDVDGDAIAEGVSYKVFVLSVADGINATENALSAASAAITLSSDGGGGGGGGGGDKSGASAALASAGSKAAGAAFDLSITGAKDTDGTALAGSIAVTVTSDLDGEVYSGSVTFTGGEATVTIAAGEVTTAGTNTLTVAITGVTPKPAVEVTVAAASQISPANSTAEISPPLAEGTTSTITVTLRDAYNNPMASTTKNLKIEVTITAADGTTPESYTVDGEELTETPALPLDRAGEATDADGKIYFDVTVPAAVDAGDGITVQVIQNNGTKIGSAFSYSGGDQSITVSNIEATNTLGKFKFDTDTATTVIDLEGKIMAGGADAVDIALRAGDTTGMLWNAFFATTPEYNTVYEITCESPFTISGGNTVMWPGGTAAPAATGVTAIDVADNGNGSDLEVSFTRPNGENTKIASYRIMVVKSAAASTFNLSVANSVYEDYYTTVAATGADSYTTTLVSDAKDVDGDSIVAGTAYKVFVLSIADGTNATVNALSDASNEVTLGGGGEPSAVAPKLESVEVTNKGDISLTFDKAITDPTGIGSEPQFTVKVNDVAAEISYVTTTNTPTKIKIVMVTKITSSQVVTVAYTKGAVAESQITSTDGGVLETFEPQTATNGSPLS